MRSATVGDSPTDREDPGFAEIVEALVGPDGAKKRFAAQIVGRYVEYDAVIDVLMAGSTPGVDRERALQVAQAIAAGCLGEQHLWRDMRLPNRAVLRRLLETYFEPLAADNVMDMRWKKFIYRRVCRWGGFHTCAAPSCSACSSYDECFGSPV